VFHRIKSFVGLFFKIISSSRVGQSKDFEPKRLCFCDPERRIRNVFEHRKRKNKAVAGQKPKIETKKTAGIAPGGR
jgi:hypothetical protein